MSLTISVPKTIMVEEKIKINAKQKLFCELYCSFEHEMYGNATRCYMKAYGQNNYLTATSSAKQLISKPEIMAYINKLLSNEGFNDQNVDKQHLFIINQHKDLPTKMKGIQEYNKLKKRITDRMELIIPKPVMELDDDEVIHKIDKGKAREIRQGNEDIV